MLRFFALQFFETWLRYLLQHNINDIKRISLFFANIMSQVGSNFLFFHCSHSFYFNFLFFLSQLDQSSVSLVPSWSASRATALCVSIFGHNLKKSRVANCQICRTVDLHVQAAWNTSFLTRLILLSRCIHFLLSLAMWNTQLIYQIQPSSASGILFGSSTIFLDRFKSVPYLVRHDLVCLHLGCRHVDNCCYFKAANLVLKNNADFFLVKQHNKNTEDRDDVHNRGLIHPDSATFFSKIIHSSSPCLTPTEPTKYVVFHFLRSFFLLL